MSSFCDFYDAPPAEDSPASSRIQEKVPQKVPKTSAEIYFFSSKLSVFRKHSEWWERRIMHKYIVYQKSKVSWPIYKISGVHHQWGGWAGCQSHGYKQGHAQLQVPVSSLCSNQGWRLTLSLQCCSHSCFCGQLLWAKIYIFCTMCGFFQTNLQTVFLSIANNCKFLDILSQAKNLYLHISWQLCCPKWSCHQQKSINHWERRRSDQKLSGVRAPLVKT